MTGIRKIVDVLPIIDQNTLPSLELFCDLPADCILSVQYPPSSTHDLEEEIILALLTTYAVRSHVWQPVSMKEFRGLMFEALLPSKQTMIPILVAIWDLARRGVLDIVSLEEERYVVIKPAFAEKLTKSTVTVTKSRSPSVEATHDFDKSLWKIRNCLSELVWQLCAKPFLYLRHRLTGQPAE